MADDDPLAKHLCPFNVKISKTKSKNPDLSGTWTVSSSSVLHHSATCFGQAKPKSSELQASATVLSELESNRGTSVGEMNKILKQREGPGGAPATSTTEPGACTLLRPIAPTTPITSSSRTGVTCTRRTANGLAFMELDNEGRFFSVTVISEAAARRCKHGMRIVAARWRPQQAHLLSWPASRPWRAGTANGQEYAPLVTGSALWGMLTITSRFSRPPIA